MGKATFLAALAAAAVMLPPATYAADNARVARGEYLVNLGACHDCHTPGYFLGEPDMSRYLGGSDVGFEIPGVGVFIGRNITPHEETGIGGWSTEDIVTALTTGERPDGRVLAPIMPYHAYAKLTDEDVQAIAAYLESVEPVDNEVPGPFGVGEEVPTFIMRVMPPGQTVAPAPE